MGNSDACLRAPKFGSSFLSISESNLKKIVPPLLLYHHSTHILSSSYLFLTSPASHNRNCPSFPPQSEPVNRKRIHRNSNGFHESVTLSYSSSEFFLCHCNSESCFKVHLLCRSCTLHKSFSQFLYILLSWKNIYFLPYLNQLNFFVFLGCH